MRRTEYTADIVAAATQERLDPDLVEALVLVESSGQTDAFRFEPLFWSRLLAKNPRYARRIPRRVSSSYGLMQILYPVAVERGYEGQPEELFIPTVGLEWGCRHLRYLQDWADTFDVTPERKIRASLAAYNGGRGGNKPVPEDALLRNDRYAAKVLKLLA